MKKAMNIGREILFDILVAIVVVSAICVIGSEFMPTEWLALWSIVNVVSVILAIYVYEPRIFYRRFVPFLVCMFAVIYKICKPILKLNKSVYKFFRKCYKIKELSGSLENCYYDVQYVYDECSGYNTEDIEC